MNRTRLVSFVFALAVLAIFTADASAYHHPTLGRWMQRDPVEHTDGMNLYQYVKSSPAIYSDPTGNVALHTSAEMPPEYKPVPPVPPGSDVNIDIDAKSLGGKEDGICGTLTIKGIKDGARLKTSFKGLKDDGTGCEFYEKLIGDMIKNFHKDVIGKKKEFKCARKNFFGGGENYKCCNKVKYDGDYNATITIGPIWLPELLTGKPICEFSASMTGTITVMGELGKCFKEED